MPVGGLPVQHRLLQASPQQMDTDVPYLVGGELEDLPIGCRPREVAVGADDVAVEWAIECVTLRIRSPARSRFDGTTPDAPHDTSPLTGQGFPTRRPTRGAKPARKANGCRTAAAQGSVPEGLESAAERDPDRVAQPDATVVPAGIDPGVTGTPTNPVPASSAAWRSQVESPIITASTGGTPRLVQAASSPSGAGFGRRAASRPMTGTPSASAIPWWASTRRVTSSVSRVTTALGMPAVSSHASASPGIALDPGIAARSWASMAALTNSHRSSPAHATSSAIDATVSGVQSAPGTARGTRSPATAAASRRAAL